MDSTDAPASEIASLREQPAALTSGEVKPEKEELDECVICMEVVKNKGTIACQHLFCFDCILNWSKRTNSCPICKRKFTKITTVTEPSPLTKTGRKRKSMKPISKSVKVKNKEQTADYGGGGGGGGGGHDLNMNLFMAMVFAHMNNAEMADESEDSDWTDDELERWLWGGRDYSDDDSEDEESGYPYIPQAPRGPSLPYVRGITPPAVNRFATARNNGAASQRSRPPTVIDLVSDDDETPPTQRRANSTPTTSSSIVDLSDDTSVITSVSSVPASSSTLRSAPPRTSSVKRRRHE